MVAEPATSDAVRRAHALGTLRVGLHVVVVAGRALLSPERIPDLVDAEGRFTTDLAGAGVRYFFHPRVRAQLRAEIEAQFAAFAATGLPFDHVNAQCHMHLHPTVFGIILETARAYGAPPVRIPYEPFAPAWRATRDRRALRFANAYALAPWLALMKARLRGAGIAHNDRVLGLSDVGHMDRARVLALLRALEPGVTEIFFHAATGRWDGIDDALRSYELENELAALTDPEVARALDAPDVERIAFADLARAR
jgi:hopanoid biosynthesis associated protein HpnK